ncbi:MAG: 2-hydroxyglutaryl-CoA dehydratase [delta proteobacterium ML8_F1]|nr:MAG: 2-hydroxyglutaryl-CoA dehydratase [delta proteobacterium ML8_F1]
MNRIIDVGLDIGSTTIKVILLRGDELVYKSYIRHFSDVRNSVYQTFKNIFPMVKDHQIRIAITGSGGFEIAKLLGIEFVQEVIASALAVERIIPDTDVAIELGGEDAKITYFGDSVEQRMNGTCAGGTGAFIDQMASLLRTDAAGLNELARGAVQIYPIASRCGVFAKTDVQPLLNEGAAREDIALSVLQAIVNQTIGGLAQGRPIRGRIAFLGGPLTFLSELRKQFVKTLKLTEEAVRFPENSEYFVAIGAAYHASGIPGLEIGELYRRVEEIPGMKTGNSQGMPPLFEDEAAYGAFRQRHSRHQVKRREIADYEGIAFLGIDSGSTTTKVVLISPQGEVLYTYYGSNEGRPLKSTMEVLEALYSRIEDRIVIARAAVTGYGEMLVKEALKVDEGEIETVAHYKGAQFFDPLVDFILDIGGQDMKSLHIEDGALKAITLNEACSSGCGSFIETFAHSLELDVTTFTQKALKSRNPVDLGTRCTVFMNSKVKQAQKEGAPVEDIAAGIAVSVIKNALYKVIRMRSPEDLGKHIVVQGGTFYSDSVLRSFEQLTGREVVRPDIAGIMGAFGAALIARERHVPGEVSTILSRERLRDLTIEQRFKRCGLCPNNCRLTINIFSDGREYITGNRCERGGNHRESKTPLPNLYRDKYERVFDYPSLPVASAHRGEIGLPRVLGMYEDYPFWHTLLTALGYRVVLSGRSNKKVFEMGMESIPSESVCYPAKLVHGHIEMLLKKGVKKIFYPSVVYNRLEDKGASNHYNCPVVASYSETIKANLEGLKNPEVVFMNPFVPLDNPGAFVKEFHKVMKGESLGLKEIRVAVAEAYKALDAYQSWVRDRGEQILNHLKEHQLKGIVLGGRPYHVDPEINHGIPELIESMGFAVLSEDAVAHLGRVPRPLRVMDQWVYHSRLYSAAAFVAENRNLEFVQLNSFGCGLDAVTIDQVGEILRRNNRLHTVLKIDEINNLGAARIRLRSLMASVKERDEKGILPSPGSPPPRRVVFTTSMRKNHTIIAPQLSPIHFELLEDVFNESGYRLKILKETSVKSVDTGLKYVNNDACYPAVIVVGQLMEALESGEYDPSNTSILISQTGGGCRATNYIAFIRKALEDGGFQGIPVISLSAQGIERNPGFKLDLRLIQGALRALVYGDLLMRLLYRIRPYETFKNSAENLYGKWIRELKGTLLEKGSRGFKSRIHRIVEEFDQLAIDESLVLPRIGVVGEILVKYHPFANNNIVKVIESEGAEAVVPDLLDFFMYSFYNTSFRSEHLGKGAFAKVVGDVVIRVMESYRSEMRKALERSRRFSPPPRIQELSRKVEGLISQGNQSGEGWFLTAEMVELIEEGVPNIFCIQPFGCLPNHVVGKGMIKKLRETFPNSNIVAIDYDSGASEVNQLNRIKLMVTTALKNLSEGRVNVDLGQSLFPRRIDGL